MEAYVPSRRRIWLYSLTALILFLLVVPTLVVIPMSFSSASSLSFPPPDYSLKWYVEYFTSSRWQHATGVSARVALMTTVFATTIGTMAAYSLHVSAHYLRTSMYSVLMVPLMVPLILIGIGTFFAYAAVGLLNTITGLVLADSMIAIPFVLVTVTAGLRSYDMNQEMVARSLGANRLVAFLTVTLPQIKYSIISAALLAFIVAFDEVVIAVFIAKGSASTLTRVMFSSLRYQIDPTIAAVSTMLIVIATVPPLLLQLLFRKRTDGSA